MIAAKLAECRFVDDDNRSGVAARMGLVLNCVLATKNREGEYW